MMRGLMTRGGRGKRGYPKVKLRACRILTVGLSLIVDKRDVWKQAYMTAV